MNQFSYLLLAVASILAVFTIAAITESVLQWMFTPQLETALPDYYEEGEDVDCMPSDYEEAR